MMCAHGQYEGETASGDDITLDCHRCEKRREWSEEDRRDYYDELADLRRQRHESIFDGADGWS